MKIQRFRSFVISSDTMRQWGMFSGIGKRLWVVSKVGKILFGALMGWNLTAFAIIHSKT